MEAMNQMQGCWIIPVIFCLIVMYFVFTGKNRNFFSWFSNQESEDRNSINNSWESPLDILQKRYANGEITESEYLEMKRNLS